MYESQLRGEKIRVFERGGFNRAIGMRGKRGFHSALIGRNKEEGEENYLGA